MTDAERDIARLRARVAELEADRDVWWEKACEAERRCVRLREALGQARAQLDWGGRQTAPQWRQEAVRIIDAALSGSPAPVGEGSFQSRVQPWLMECFGPEISANRVERNHRFLEEALELVQACGCTQGEAHQLVDYVYGRPSGEINQEVGGVMVTLAALCLAQGVNMHDAGEVELKRIWGKVEQIRAKQAAKPKNSPLPAEPAPVEPTPEERALMSRVRSDLERRPPEGEAERSPSPDDSNRATGSSSGHLGEGGGGELSGAAPTDRDDLRALLERAADSLAPLVRFGMTLSEHTVSKLSEDTACAEFFGSSEHKIIMADIRHACVLAADIRKTLNEGGGDGTP